MNESKPLPLPSLPSARAALLLCLFGLLIRAALLFAGPWQDPARAMQPDSHRYVLLGKNLLAFGTFGKLMEDGIVHQAVARLRAANGTLPPADANGLRPEGFRTPGYPFFLALCDAGGGVRLALAIQCLLGASEIWLVMAIAAALGLPRRGVLCVGWLWTLHPALVLYDVLILSESLFNWCAIAGLALATRSPALRWPLLSGFMLGLASLVRPLLGVGYFPAVAALIWDKQQPWIRSLTVVAATALAPIGLWALRNQSVGEGLRLSSGGEIQVLFYYAAYATAEERGEDWHGSWPTRVRELVAKLEERIAPGADVYVECRRLAAEELAARPRAVERMYAKSFVKLLIDHTYGDVAHALGASYEPSGVFARLVLREHPGKMASDQSNAALLAVLGWMVFNCIIALGALLGFVRAAWRRQYRLLCFCVPTIAMFVAASGGVGLERFRLPIMLPLFVLAASVWPQPAGADPSIQQREQQ